MTGTPSSLPLRLAAALLALAPALPEASRAAAAGEPVVVRHELSVGIDPEARRLAVVDTVTLPPGLSSRPGGALRFLLHAGLSPASPSPGVSLTLEERPIEAADFGLPPERFDPPAGVPLEMFRVEVPPEAGSFVLTWSGPLDHPLVREGEDYARGFSETPGTISPEGVYLAGSSGWYPWFGGEPVAFALEAALPGGWDAVSQGRRTLHEREEDRTRVRWESPEPQEEIFLVAARFTEISRAHGAIEAMAFLREPDEGLAAKYLDVTGQYLDMYGRLLGPYPYAKFALVENFWETGYGMPSFTLLGPTVIRLPFILHSSYPHEILHNWWGNGVYVEAGAGNWSEGLTAYLADHLIQEQRGTAAEYRQATLQKYADYVSRAKDFPLSEFRSRRNPATEAIGYGKTMMFFHMLRRDLGDGPFVRALRSFYEANRFRGASFDDLSRAFGAAAGRDLSGAFEQWTNRPGAPRLRVTDAGADRDAEGWLLTARIEQTQPGDPFRLRVPLVVTLEGREEAVEESAALDGRSAEVRLRLPARPLRLDVDPQFDLFRALDRSEIPPALSQAFGAGKALVVLPAAAPQELKDAYRAMADGWRAQEPDRIGIAEDAGLESLPAGRAVWLFGWENRFRDSIAAAAAGYGAALEADGVRFETERIATPDRSFAMTVRHPADPDHPLAWIAADRPDALPGLARKLPHYHKYSWLAFEGGEPVNIAKGRWPVVGSPMTVLFPPAGSAASLGRLAPREALASLPPAFSKERMMRTVRSLAAEEMRGRGFGSPELDRAAEEIAAAFREAGLHPGGDLPSGGEAGAAGPSAARGWFQEFEATGGRPERTATLRNVIGLIPGRSPQRAGESVVLAAHYDHLGTGWPEAREGNAGRIHPGADDNASGVAVLIELARALAAGPAPERTIVFAAFAGEEAERLGSRHYVTADSSHPVRSCIGMVNLDTVGRLGDGKLLVLGAGSAREWVHIFNGAGYVTGVPIQSVADDFGASDQKSFLDAGVPAVQLFSGPNLDYHSPTDTSDRIDAEGLVKVASVAREAIEYLAGRPEPMTATLAAGGPERAAPGGEGSGRRVSLGTIPDFAFTGPGVRLSGVVPGSAAESAGLREGDVLVGLDGRAIGGLREFSDALKSLEPGRRVAVRFLREGTERTVEAVVTAR